MTSGTNYNDELDLKICLARVGGIIWMPCSWSIVSYKNEWSSLETSD